jgi:glycosyltransferase involved in cell wall biosynthesis
LKPKILHIIFNLGRGGAETMLVNMVKEVEEYDHVILTLFRQNDFGDEVQNARIVCMDLQLRDLLLFPLVARKLKKIILRESPVLVHTHLYWPTILARMATPLNIPLVTTIHAFVSQLVDFKKWYLKKLYRYSYQLRPSTMIAVASGALQEYYNFLDLKPGKNHVLYTFVDTAKFTPVEKSISAGTTLKLVTVGALRYQKNHEYLVEALKQLKPEDASVDIYGEGPLRDDIRQKIHAAGVNINLMGQVNNIAARLHNYDLFVMPSFYEGFSLGVLEAMAMKIPLLLADIPSFREQCGETAIYFDLQDPSDLAKKISALKSDPTQLKNKSEAAYRRVIDNFTLPIHLEKLRDIYRSELGETAG